jgi:hypothetical protein
MDEFLLSVADVDIQPLSEHRVKGQ